MTQEQPPLKIRTALTAFPERYELPARPSAASPLVQDAYRQTQFLLPADLALFERAMNLQLAIVAANAKRRTPAAAALFGLWSRAFAYLADACTLLSRGSYVSCPPILRTACDCIAAQRSLLSEDADDFSNWLANAYRQDPEKAALALNLGRFRAGSVLAQDESLGAAYRLLTDLSMPHFGATALLVAPDSGLQRLSITFADSAFHLGWAELIAGWLLLLADLQLETAIGSGLFAVGDQLRQEHERLSLDIATAVANPRRCQAQELEGGRRLIRNFRRSSSGVPKRILL